MGKYNDEDESVRYVPVKHSKDIPACISNLRPSMELITPEKADEYLNTMERNRVLNNRRVNKYSSDLINGTFTICLDPICFDCNGIMINGQHRCEAIKRTGIPAWVSVYRNVPKDTIIDRGAERTTGQSLYMRGVVTKEMGKSEYMAIVKAYLRCKHYAGYENVVTEDKLGEFINSYQENLFKAYSLSRSGGSKQICKKAGFQAALFAALCCGVNEEILRRFVEITNSGFCENANESAAIVMRNYLLEYSGTGWKPACELTAVAENAIACFAAKRPRHKSYKKPEHIYIDRCKADI